MGGPTLFSSISACFRPRRIVHGKDRGFEICLARYLVCHGVDTERTAQGQIANAYNNCSPLLITQMQNTRPASSISMFARRGPGSAQSTQNPVAQPAVRANFDAPSAPDTSLSLESPVAAPWQSAQELPAQRGSLTAEGSADESEIIVNRRSVQAHAH